MKRHNFWTRPLRSDSANDVFMEGFSVFGKVSGLLLTGTLLLTVPFTPAVLPFVLTASMMGTLVCAIAGGTLSFFTYCLLRTYRGKVNRIGSILTGMALALLLTFFPLGLLVLATDDQGWIPAIPLALCLTLIGRIAEKIYEMLASLPPAPFVARPVR